MTTATLEAPTLAPVRDRWCYKCGDYVTALGYHWPDGAFNSYSVEVTDVEIERAVSQANKGQVERIRRELKLPSIRQRTRYAIALGLHIGTYA